MPHELREGKTEKPGKKKECGADPASIFKGRQEGG